MSAVRGAVCAELTVRGLSAPTFPPKINTGSRKELCERQLQLAPGQGGEGHFSFRGLLHTPKPEEPCSGENSAWSRLHSISASETPEFRREILKNRRMRRARRTAAVYLRGEAERGAWELRVQPSLTASQADAHSFCDSFIHSFQDYLFSI